MSVKAEISDFQWMPMIEGIPSILEITFTISATHEIITIRETGMLEYLSKKFQFKIVNKHEWNFGDFIGRKCTLEKDGLGYRFIRFTAA